MAIHTIMLPASIHDGKLRSITWNDVEGTVEGDHNKVEYIRRMLAAEKPVTVGDPGGTWDLRDPAHDPAEFLTLLYMAHCPVLDEPLRSTLPPVFDGIEIPPPDPGEILYIDEETTPGARQEILDDIADEDFAATRAVDFARTFNDALNRLPDETGSFWRGVQLSEVEQAAFTPGSVLTWAGISTTSRRRGGAFASNTRFIITARRGKDIQPYSARPRAEEVVFRPGSRFRVMGSPRRHGGVLEMELEEIDT
ncbi:MAG: hypothetical protein OXF88_03725 [Rhodobacteraceae bacterium]|nr:hypothetical protein [Paracoccaceae bacterium]MCY4137023.1 hypothetical protein [Paracoccaceae bacterium]